MKRQLLSLAGILLLFSLLGCSQGNASNKETPVEKIDYLHLTLDTIEGNNTTLSAYSGKVVLIVNTASRCGYTPQYEGLEKLYAKYKDQGLVVIGFPANNFGGQEPGTNNEIRDFCRDTYAVDFPMMAKISVAGDDIHPLFKYLTEQSPLTGEIKWNFNKFLLDRQGKLIARWPSKVTPEDSELVDTVVKSLN